MTPLYSHKLNIRILGNRGTVGYGDEIVIRFRIIAPTGYTPGQSVKLNMEWIYRY